MQKGNGVVDFNWHGPVELTIFVMLTKIICGYLAMPTKAWGLTYEEGVTMGIVSKITTLIKTTLYITLLTLLKGTMYVYIYILSSKNGKKQQFSNLSYISLIFSKIPRTIFIKEVKSFMLCHKHIP